MDQDSFSEKDYLLKSPSFSKEDASYRSFHEGAADDNARLEQEPSPRTHKAKSQRSLSEPHRRGRTLSDQIESVQALGQNGQSQVTPEPSSPPLSSSPVSNKNGDSDVIDHNPKDRWVRMAFLTLVTFFYSCASKLHGPMLTQYAYQVFTDSVYGNESVGVHISKQPCVNDTGNASTDPRSKEVQDKSADLLMQLDLVSGGLSIVVNLFLGSYSDVLGRRVVLLVPIVGHFLRNATAPVVIHWDLGPSYLYVGYAIDGLCGGASGVALGLYVYTADITSSDKSRTVGMAVVDTATGLTGALAYLGAGYFIEYTGFFYPALVSAIFLLMSALVILCLLPETVPRDRKGWFSPAEGARRVFSIFLSRGQKYQRAFLWMGLLAFFLAMMPEFADAKVRSLYLMNEPFCWSSVQIGIFQAAKDGASRCSSLFLIKVLQRCVVTPALAVIAATTYVAGDVLMALARHDLAVFMVPVVSMGGYMVFAAIRSMMSRLVPPHKQGALFAAIAVVESACYCMGQTTFFPVYQATMHVFQGVIFFFFAGFHFFIIVIYVMYLCLFRRVVPSQVAPISVQTEDIPDS